MKANQLQTIVHIPDTILTELIRLTETDDYFDVLSPSREEEGVGILAGSYLGGRYGALLMQNSGLGNAANILGSLAVPYQLPFLMPISQHGGRPRRPQALRPEAAPAAPAGLDQVPVHGKLGTLEDVNQLVPS
jgi:sulfopyruvate decarboxylase TPP-binding subunit